MWSYLKMFYLSSSKRSAKEIQTNKHAQKRATEWAGFNVEAGLRESEHTNKETAKESQRSCCQVKMDNVKLILMEKNEKALKGENNDGAAVSSVKRRMHLTQPFPMAIIFATSTSYVDLYVPFTNL